MPEAFFGVTRVDEDTFDLPVTLPLCSGLRTLFGGATMGAAATVCREVTGREPVWLSGQFLSVAHPGDTVRLQVHRPATGRSLSQLRIVGVGRDREIVHVAATCGRGSRDAGPTSEPTPPRVLPPDDSPPRPLLDRFAGTIIERVDLRLAVADAPDATPGVLRAGVAGFWARLPELPASAAAMAVIGDLVPAGLVATLQRPAVAQSLDNTLRIVRDEPTEWYLVVVRLDGADRGLLHGTATVWSDGGRVLGVASQTAVLRPFPDA